VQALLLRIREHPQSSCSRKLPLQPLQPGDLSINLCINTDAEDLSLPFVFVYLTQRGSVYAAALLYIWS